MDFLQGEWSGLAPLQLGRYAEQLVTMAFVLHGCDVYRAEVDDRGIDLVVRTRSGQFREVQVKASRKGSEPFFKKDRFDLSPERWAAIVLFEDGRVPDMYLIPSIAWQDEGPPFFGNDFPGKRTEPEWRLSLAQKYRPVLEQYRFSDRIGGFL